jgi:hypothetical protein
VSRGRHRKARCDGWGEIGGIFMMVVMGGLAIGAILSGQPVRAVVALAGWGLALTWALVSLRRQDAPVRYAKRRRKH